jgi:hypothetical protein
MENRATLKLSQEYLEEKLGTLRKLKQGIVEVGDKKP